MQIEWNGKTRVRPVETIVIGEQFMVAIDPRVIYMRIGGLQQDVEVSAKVMDSDGHLDAGTHVTLPPNLMVVRVSPVVIYRAV
jgi:hypothetical protein